MTQIRNLYVDTLYELSQLRPDAALIVFVGEDGSTHVGNGTEFKSGGSGSGGDALTSDPLSQFADTTSEELASIITNKTGAAGKLVFSDGPTLVTPDLGTPSAVNLANATNLPIANTTGTLPINRGGTGGTSAAGARTNIGLGNVDNTSDINKPVSNPTLNFVADAINDLADIKADKFITENQQSGVAYTPVLADIGKAIVISNANPITFTIPTNATVAFPIGTSMVIEQGNFGQVTVVGAAGVTVHAFDGTKTQGQYAAVQIRKVSTNVWVLYGGIS